MKGTVVLSHGLESGPGATKVSALAEVARARGWAEVRPDYRDIDATRSAAAIDARVQRALEHAPAEGPVLFAGSSMGAFVSGLASLERTPAGLFLMALPCAIPGYGRAFEAAPVPTVLVHGWRDELCAVEPVLAWAGERSATLHLVDDDHRLGAHVEWCAQVFDLFLRRLG